MAFFAKQFETWYENISGNIFQFCEKGLNFSPTWQQRQLLEFVQKGTKRIACKSGQGPGKTTAAAVIGMWRTIRHDDAMTVLTAPTMRQCKDVWLAECRRLMEKAHPYLRTMINVSKSKVIIAGRPDWCVTLVTATRPENAQGMHEKNMTIICEEASGIPSEIWEQFEGTLTNENAMMIGIGNPNTRDCEFFKCFNMWRHRWETLTFNAEESPIVSKENIEYIAEKYGRDSDVYRVRVLGEFPYSDPNCVMSSEDCEACTRTSIQDAVAVKVGNLPASRQFGIDFARFGSDESVIYRRIGGAIVEQEFFSHTEPARVAEHAFLMQRNAGWRDADCWYVPDADGMGQGVMHVFHDAKKKIFEFQTQSVPMKRDFENRMTEAYFLLGDLVKSRGIKIPNDNRLIQQLSTRQYLMTKKGQIVLEKKDDFIKRVGESPDRADALAMAFYWPALQGARLARKKPAPRRAGVVLR